MKYSSMLIQLFVLCTLSQFASAEVPLTRITKGATNKDVITLIGAPLEQIEKEIKRQTVWVYPSGSIVFSQGKAISVYTNGNTQDLFSNEYRKSIEPVKPVNNQNISNPVEDILSEILREVPSEAGAEGASGNLAPGEVRPLDVGR